MKRDETSKGSGGQIRKLVDDSRRIARHPYPLRNILDDYSASTDESILANVHT
jgi:hypothetical protein